MNGLDTLDVWAALILVGMLLAVALAATVERVLPYVRSWWRRDVMRQRIDVDVCGNEPSAYTPTEAR